MKRGLTGCALPTAFPPASVLILEKGRKVLSVNTYMPCPAHPRGECQPALCKRHSLVHAFALVHTTEGEESGGREGGRGKKWEMYPVIRL